ncbi:TPA: O1 family O-antigen polymerase, partial [Escherichia coli]|nr:O1 family O-antigen polymerase [Escherichia coli]
VTMCYVSVYYYFYKNCIKHALPWMVLAILFHYSALLLFMSLFIYSYRRLLIVIIGFVICMSFLNVYADTIALYLPNEKIVNYLYSISSSLDNRNDLAIFNLNNIIFLSIFILIFYLSRYIKLNDNEAKFIKYVQCSGILAFCIFFLASGVPVIAYRTAELLRIFYPMALVLILSHIKNNNMRYFIAVIIVILSGLMLFITLRAVSIVGQGL